MNKKNFIKEKLQAGVPVIGLWSIINSPTTVEIAAVAGFDFQVLDMEHGPYDLTTLLASIRSMEGAGCSPIIRVPYLERSIIQSSLDLGSHGIIIPQINGYNEAVFAVQTTQLAPAGCRGYNPFTRAGYYYAQDYLQQTKISSDFPLTSVIIETKSALQELDKILEIPGLDVIYIGVYDLSFSMGYNGNIHHPELDIFVVDAIKKIKRQNKFSALMAHDEDSIKRYLDIGVNMITCGVDTHLYYSSIKKKSAIFKEIIATKKVNIK